MNTFYLIWVAIAWFVIFYLMINAVADPLTRIAIALEKLSGQDNKGDEERRNA